MADFLVYWKNYWKDTAEDPSSFNEKWHTGHDSVWKKIKRNDNIWVIIYGKELFPNEWRLLQRIAVFRKFRTSGKRPYGILGYKNKGQRFDTATQSDFTPKLHRLKFISGKKIDVSGVSITHRVQEIRPLTDADSALLKDYSRTLVRHGTDAAYPEIIDKEFEKFVRKKGAGFGNPTTNKKVEKAAVAETKHHYESRGWTVITVEAEKFGYDLRCTKGPKEHHVEVKGIQGDLPHFIITAGEVKRAQNDDDFFICAVTLALSANPKIHFYTGKEFTEKFDLTPLAFRAISKKLRT